MDELCKICERVSFGRITLTGFGHWRHEQCVIGSQDWLLYYQRLPAKTKNVLREYHTYFKGVSYK